MATNNQWYEQAKQQYMPNYNKQVEALKNQLQQNQLALDGSKTGINQNYDNQVYSQNLNNIKTKNNYNNVMAGRGLSNSSIVGSGLAEKDMINNRVVNNINTDRTNKLNEIDSQKALLEQQMNGQLSTMEGDLDDRIWTLARQLEDRQWDKDYKTNQFEFDKQYKTDTFNWDKEYKNMMAKIQQDQFEKEFGLKREQFASDRDYKNAMLAMQQQEAYNKQNQQKEIDSFKVNGAMKEIEYIMNSPEIPDSQKKQILNSYVSSFGGSSYNSIADYANKYMNQMNPKSYNGSSPIDLGYGNESSGGNNSSYYSKYVDMIKNKDKPSFLKGFSDLFK